MKCSIITACYNSASNIEATIQSLLSQQISPENEVEYIIIDGKSTDNTLEIVNKYKSSISLILSEKDKGIYDALNKGIQRATGDIIGFLHSDDMLYENDVLQSIMDVFSAQQCDAVYGNGVYVAASDPSKVIRNWISGEFDRQKLTRGWMPMHPSLFIKREHYIRYGLFNDTYRIAADYDLVLRIMSVPSLRFIYINKYIIKMKLGGASNSFKNLVKKWKEDYTVMKSHNLSPVTGLLYKNLSKVKQFFTK